MLTKKQKLEIIDFLSYFSTKAVMECVEEMEDDIGDDQTWKDVERFLVECHCHMQEMKKLLD